MIVVVLGQFRLIVGQPRVHKFSKVIAQVRLGVCVCVEWSGKDQKRIYGAGLEGFLSHSVLKVIMMDRGSTLYTPRLEQLQLRMTYPPKYAATTKVPSKQSYLWNN